MRVETHQTPIAASNPLRVREGLETAFLAEMLNIAMPSSGDSPFGGGAGESQFASFMNEQYATALAGRLNLGLTGRLGVRNG